MTDLKSIPLSLGDFAVPVPRSGSIEAHSGYGRATAEGIEIHKRVQLKRTKAFPNYEAEVTISRSFERGDYRFEISGRMDGVFSWETPKIEEIKSSFNIKELLRRLKDQNLDHPYCLQLLTYGYFYWQENQIKPELTLHLVSSRNGDSEDLELKLDIALYERWLNLRLDELELEAQKAEKRVARRKKIAADFMFPFATPRQGQIELIQSIEEGIVEHTPMLIQAPTGLGKTAGVLYPALKEALSRGQKVVYVTPKNSQHAVAEDAITRFQETGAKVKSLTITAKSKICFKNEPLCNPKYCEYALDYYTKVHASGLLDLLAKKKKLRTKTFRDLGEEYQVCPFELQLDGAQEADTVICDYNYVFAPRSSFGRLAIVGIGQTGKPNLVIDEAHNLPARAMDYFSPTLSSFTLEKMRDEIRHLPSRFQEEIEEILDDCIAAIVSSGSSAGSQGGSRSGKTATQPLEIDPPVEMFLERDSELRGFLSRYLDSDIEIQPKDVVLRLCFYWSEFTETLQFVGDPEHDEFFTTFHPHPTGGIVKITCCDASELIEDCYDDYEQVIAFSATLKPFEYYAKLSGLDPEKVKKLEFQSPFPKANRKVLIIPQISTKYSERERNYSKIAEGISRIAALRRGNYFAFFPSFDFLERVAALMNPLSGYTFIAQERDMKAPQVQEIIEHLRSQIAPTIVFAVQGGSFSEGVDYPGEMVIGAFVVGPPLPSFDLEREHMKQYYQKHYHAGFDYAYTIPAMAKAIQAAGRVIRSETDRGLIVLMDNRFVLPNYSRTMPRDWFETQASELVSTRILKEVSEFWEHSLILTIATAFVGLLSLHHTFPL